MISIEKVTYSYRDSTAPALRELSLTIAEGEFLLVPGPSGAGKSSLLRLLNGLVPHFYGGRFAGRVRVWGRDTLACQPRDMADLVGFVVELAAACADRVALLGDGELVVESPAREILGQSLLFSSQIAKLFPQSEWLTVDQALAGLGVGIAPEV